MKILTLLLILYAAGRTASLDNSNINDPIVEDNSDVLWKVLYTKLNIILNVTGVLGENIANLQERQLEQEQRTRTLWETMNADVKKYMDDSFAELRKKQAEHENKLSDIVQKLDEYHMESTKRFDDLTDRQNNQEDLILAINNQTQSQSWTTILQRLDGSVDFYRDWNDYKKGFGNPPNGEFFIGLDKLHELTSESPQELLVVLREWTGEMVHAHYDLFKIAGENEKYAITSIGNYNGDAGDSMEYHLGMPFSTYDQDNDISTRNCATYFRGAWWFKSCYASHLNGPYRLEAAAEQAGVSWDKWKKDYSFQYAVMKIRPKTFWKKLEEPEL
ncbi:ficolin-2-like [Haematobia irritans]|uniref:ficolin-2-like n=1 Tax=Haematobia irritans TaxID=7368 RepID=UPI003F50628F